MYITQAAASAYPSMEHQKKCNLFHSISINDTSNKSIYIFLNLLIFKYLNY